MLNRLLDLQEAMDEGSTAGIDNADFVGTDVPPPHDMPLPAAAWLSEEKREETKDWVIAVSMDHAGEQSLPKGTVPTLAQSSWPRCVVTGFPVAAGELVKCSACASPATKVAWNQVVVKTKACPWCGAVQSPAY
jgi:intraflagellar transport protein 172